MRHESLVWAISIASAYLVLDGCLAVFYIIGHMANNLKMTRQFIKEGANAIEIDVQFNSYGRPYLLYHGPPCDCFRMCDDMESFDEYMNGIRNLTGPGGSFYLSRLRFLMLDLKFGAYCEGFYYECGFYLVEDILKTLWKNVNPRVAVNVMLSISATKYRQVFIGAINAIYKHSAYKYFVNLGFAIDDFSEGAEKVEGAFLNSAIHARIWVGTGITNCFPYMAYDEEKDLLHWHHKKGGFKVDGIFHWTVDAETSIQSVIDKGYDGVITNRPRRARDIANKSGVSLADYWDQPW